MLDMWVKTKWIPKALENRPEWDKAAYNRVLPLIDVAKLCAAEVRARVITRSEDAAGAKFSKYATNRFSHYVFYVRKDHPQPGRGIIKRFPNSQTVGYRSSRSYHKELKKKENKNFWVTGDMWKSLRVRPMTPFKVRAAFYGSDRRGVPNKDKAFYAARNENLGILWISEKEVDTVYKFLNVAYDARLSTLIQEEEAAFKVQQVAGRIERRIQRAQRQLDAAKSKAKA